MKISSKVWDKYVADLRKINDKAAELVAAYYTAHPPATSEALDALLAYCYGIATKYGEAAAELTAQMYDAVALADGRILDAAFPAETATYDEVARTVVGTLKVTTNTEAIGASVARLVKMAGVDTTMQNALRDGAEWAWVPRGMTCAFCIMLASQGWQPASKKAIKGGHAEHIHANCDCTYAIRFDRSSNVAGYDQKEYEDLYYYEHNADGSIKVENGKPVPRAGSARNKLKSMRRDFYAQNKEVINEQKRDAYEKREERNSSAAEETDIE